MTRTWFTNLLLALLVAASIGFGISDYYVRRNASDDAARECAGKSNLFSPRNAYTRCLRYYHK